MKQAVYHGRLLRRLLGKTALLREPDPARGEPVEPYIVMAQFDDIRLVYAIDWWPFFRSDFTLYPETWDDR